MNRDKFLEILSKELSDIHEDDKMDILFDYNEHFSIGIQAGRTEEEIAESLGEPRTIAKQIEADYKINKAENTASTGNVFRAVFAVISLGLFNLIFVLGPFLGIVGVLLGLFVSAIALVFSGIALFIATLISPILPEFVSIPPNPIISIILSIGIIALGMLFTIGVTYLTKWFYKITVKYLRMNMNIVSDRRVKVER
ncbi:HAAS signaling domain-containing protein [Brassicibacter mesophilus]|uniref:HAAS signaling domain-containing protein n=1 Tax=Brassicibacter mesophilus TaxID=745119 RepID=UPI003D2429DA